MNGGDMEADKDSLISSIDNFLNDENLELYDINIVNFPTLSKIEIFVYSENNNKYVNYERLSYQIQRLIEEFGIDRGTYELIVSSPGVERLIKTNRHFQLSLNESIKIKLYESIKGEYIHNGILKEVNNEYIVLSKKDKDLKIDIKNIKKTKIVYDKFKEVIKS